MNNSMLIGLDQIATRFLKTLSMQKTKWFLFIASLVTVLLYPGAVQAQPSTSAALSGRVIDSHSEPIQNAQVKLYLNKGNKEFIHSETNHDGVFLLDIAPENLLAPAWRSLIPIFNQPPGALVMTNYKP